MQITVRVNKSEFTRTLRLYASLSRRTPAQVCDKKAYYITRRAIWYTPRVAPEKIAHELEANEAFELHVNKSGKNKGKYSRAKAHRYFEFGSAQNPENARIIKIIVARLRKTGAAIPPMVELKRMAQKLFKARLRSSGFLKSGWIPARDLFRSHAGGSAGAGLPPAEKSTLGGPKQIGQPKGGGKLAETGWKTVAKIWNSASENRDNKNALQKYGEPALEQAIEEEEKSMREEIERRLREAANKAGVRTR
ncbi:MAG TPA: hypothetical protein VG028_13270 [Terriglobia bacterium]|nr:hypothetical protein [Terriglobia bacterium]